MGEVEEEAEGGEKVYWWRGQPEEENPTTFSEAGGQMTRREDNVSLDVNRGEVGKLHF